MSLERFCRKPVASVAADDTAASVAERMRSSHVGAVIVMDGDRPIGMLTDRDLTCRVLAEHRNPETTLARDVMSPEMVFCRVTERIDEAIFKMGQTGVRRLPILGARGEVAGMVALDDLMVLLAAELGESTSAVRANRGP